jgi:hypothetical protein
MRDSARWLFLGALVALAACGRGGERDELRRARLAAEARGLATTIDVLEDRLIVNQARVRFWQEMRERHASVTAVSCATQESHAVDMARVLERNAADRAARRPRVARAPAEPNPTVGRN